MKTVLTTVVDENYLEYAKQLFSGAYFNAGWKGDFLLIAHEVPREKLQWFIDKGIYVMGCKKFDSREYIERWHVSVMSKVYLFTTKMKRWDKVLYLDVDMIIRASLDKLMDVENLAFFVEGPMNRRFDVSNKRLFKEFKKKYNKR